VPGEWCEDQRFAVKIDVLDFDGLDSIDDHIREELAKKGTAENFIRKLIAFELQKIRSETVVALLSQIITANDSGLAAVQLCFAAGMMLTADKSGTDYASEYGISKQAFEQGVEHYRAELGLGQTRVMRNKEARDRMSLTNYRKMAYGQDA
jgi:hypothetical protein